MSNLADVKTKDILPSSIAEDQNVQELSATNDSYLHEIFEKVQCILLLPNLDTLPEDVVDSLAWQYHVAEHGAGGNLLAPYQRHSGGRGKGCRQCVPVCDCRGELGIWRRPLLFPGSGCIGTFDGPRYDYPIGNGHQFGEEHEKLAGGYRISAGHSADDLLGRADERTQGSCYRFTAVSRTERNERTLYGRSHAHSQRGGNKSWLIGREQF